MPRFFITGAESTGKSTLTGQLAGHFGVTGVPEYARTYLEALSRPYEFADIETIARRQIELILAETGQDPVFFDTCLINLVVWFREVYKTVPGWLHDAVPGAGRGIYLVCQPDLPWQYDPLRENPHRRDYLNELYEAGIREAGFTYFRVSGTGDLRLANAIAIVNQCLNLNTDKHIENVR